MRKIIKIIWCRINRRFFDRPKLKFISWFDSLFPGKYCWADCVSWSFASDRFNPFKIERSVGCEMESKEHEHKTCYCGGWENGTCFAKLSKDEKEKYRKLRANSQSDLNEMGLPF